MAALYSAVSTLIGFLLSLPNFVTMNNNNHSSTAAMAMGAGGTAAGPAKKFAASKEKFAAGKVSDKVGGESKAKRTYGGRGLGLMKRPNSPNIPRGFGRGGKHKFAGKLRRRSTPTKPMRLSWRLSKKIQRGTPLKSPINAVNLSWTPNTLYGDMKKHAHAVEGEVKTPDSLRNLEAAKEG